MDNFHIYILLDLQYFVDKFYIHHSVFHYNLKDVHEQILELVVVDILHYFVHKLPIDYLEHSLHEVLVLHEENIDYFDEAHSLLVFDPNYFLELHQLVLLLLH